VGTDTVSGTCAESAALDAWVDWADGGTTTDVQPDHTWSVNLMVKLGVDIQPGTSGGVALPDGDGDSTRVLWRVRAPRIVAQPEDETLRVEDWVPGSQLHAVVETDGVLATHGDWLYETTVTLDAWGNADLDLRGIVDLQAGQYVFAEDGVTTRELLISPLDVQMPGVGSSIVTGTTEPSKQVNSWIDNFNEGWREVISNGSGAWSAVYTGVYTFQKGDSGGAEQPDADGDVTRVQWRIPDPRVWGDAGRNAIGVMGFPADTTVSVGVCLDPVTPIWQFRADLKTDGQGNVEAWDLGGHDLVAGEYVLAWNEDHSIERELHLETLTASADADTDIVSGTSLANRLVNLTLGDSPFWGDVTATPAGTWSVNFKTKWTIDLEPGNEGTAVAVDPDGDQTRAFWRIPDPRVWGDVVSEAIGIDDWTPSTDVTVMVDLDASSTTTGDLVFQRLVTTDENGNAYIEDWSGALDIEPGQYVTAWDGITTKSLHVVALTVTQPEAGDTSVSGTSPASAGVNHWIDQYDMSWREVTASAGGAWTVNYAPAITLAKGDSGTAEVVEPDGDATRASWYIMYPRVWGDAGRNAIGVLDFPENTTITVGVCLDPGSPSWQFMTDVKTDVNGNAEVWNLGTHDLVVGEYVGAWTADTSIVKMLQVEPLTVSAVAGSPVVSGTAAPNRAAINININGGPWGGAAANGAGAWSHTFWFNLDPGSDVNADLRDVDGDESRAFFHIPQPRFDVHPAWPGVAGWEWLPNHEVTVTVTGVHNYQTTAMTNPDGYFEGDGTPYAFSPSDVVSVTDGVSTKTLTVTDVVATWADPLTDKVYGTASPGSDVSVEIWGEPAQRDVTADGGSDWTADFSTGPDTFDIVDDTQGGAWQADDDGDRTVSDWVAEMPTIAANQTSEYVDGFGFQANSSVDVWVDTDTVPANGSLAHGTASTGPGGGFAITMPFDIVPGQYVVVSDERSTKTLHIDAMAVSVVDTLNDRISGSAPPSTQLHVIISTAPGADQWVSVGAGGLWLAPFDVSPLFNITPWTTGTLQNTDDDWDRNILDWKADTTPPVTGDDAATTYFGTATITLTPTDVGGTGVDYTMWRFDSAPVWNTGTVAATSTVGLHTLEFYSVDNAGNRETTQSVDFSIGSDLVPPVTTVTGIPAGWASYDVTVTLEATDGVGGSGVRRIWWGLGAGGPAQEYVPPLVFSSEGPHNFRVYAEDWAGNFEGYVSYNVYIDKTPPVSGASVASTYTTSASISITATDGVGHSGVASTHWRIGAGAWTTGTVATSSLLGAQTLEFYSKDAAGNEELPHQFANFTIVPPDTTPPVTTAIGIPAGWTRENATVT
ncbi:MAG TPA: hypothetical protein VF902_10100, partial [Coriobacteriia bacterium]